jgi:hypothetical protein
MRLGASYKMNANETGSLFGPQPHLSRKSPKECKSEQTSERDSEKIFDALS